MYEQAYLPEGCRLSTKENRDACATIAALEWARNEGRILEGVVTMWDGELNLIVSVGGFTGIIPREEAAFSADGEPIKDIAIISRVGKPICFMVLGVLKHAEQGQPQLLLSRRAAQAECHRYHIEKLRPGDVIPARVTHLESFGAFVDIGCGIVSLLSVDCISVSRIRHPSDRLRQGMAIRVVVKSVDEEHRRIYVTMRELLGTWEENAAAFEAGQTVTGIVRSVESYGIFVELTPNLAGLSELREEMRPVAQQWIGQRAAVFIKSICRERMKIKLVLVDTYPDVGLPRELTYYYPERAQHISHWLYSPPGCTRRIETDFDGEAEYE